MRGNGSLPEHTWSIPHGDKRHASPVSSTCPTRLAKVLCARMAPLHLSHGPSMHNAKRVARESLAQREACRWSIARTAALLFLALDIQAMLPTARPIVLSGCSLQCRSESTRKAHGGRQCHSFQENKPTQLLAQRRPLWSGGRSSNLRERGACR